MKPNRILLPFSLVYGLVVAIRNAFFEKRVLKSESAGIPVISVGNMTTGGTGKTPIVELIARELSSVRNVRTAIVSRGYKRSSTGLVVVSNGTSLCTDAANAGDEPYQLACALPDVIVIVDEVRARAARAAATIFQAGCVVLDDGFQHRALMRTLDIVLVDSQVDLFTMPMLPAGHRREPLSALARADAFIITKCTEDTDSAGITERLRRYNTRACVMTSSYEVESFVDAHSGAVHEPTKFKGARAVAFCGIGRPESFKETIVSLGIELEEFHAAGDHHRFSLDEFRMIDESASRAKAAVVLTTEKDARRMAGAFTPSVPLVYLQMRARINEPAVFEELIASALSAPGV